MHRRVPEKFGMSEMFILQSLIAPFNAYLEHAYSDGFVAVVEFSVAL